MDFVNKFTGGGNKQNQEGRGEMYEGQNQQGQGQMYEGMDDRQQQGRSSGGGGFFGGQSEGMDERQQQGRSSGGGGFFGGQSEGMGERQQQQQQGNSSGGGGFLGGLGEKFNSAAGGGRESEKNEDYLDKGVDFVQQRFMGGGPQDNESAVEQAKDEQISDFIRGQYKSTTGSDMPIKDKETRFG